MRVGQALQTVFNPLKMNFNILGNAVPHLHAHILPRYYGDPEPHRPIDPNAAQTFLEPEEDHLGALMSSEMPWSERCVITVHTLLSLLPAPQARHLTRCGRRRRNIEEALGPALGRTGSWLPDRYGSLTGRCSQRTPGSGLLLHPTSCCNCPRHLHIGKARARRVHGRDVLRREERLVRREIVEP